MTVIEIEQKAYVHPGIRKPVAGRKKRDLADSVVQGMVQDGFLPFGVRLGLVEALALASFLRDVHAGWGCSGALSPVDINRSWGRGSGSFLPPGTPTDAMLRVDRVLGRLQEHERGLLRWLEHSRERINVTLALLGREWCHGLDERDSAQRATGALQSLARSVHEHYPQAAMRVGGYVVRRRHNARKPP